jgi:hypothetical protein
MGAIAEGVRSFWADFNKSRRRFLISRNAFDLGVAEEAATGPFEKGDIGG